jgi:hypothetical protein
MRTIASAKRNSPQTRLIERATYPPRTRGCSFKPSYSPNGLNGFGLVERRTPFVSR